MYYQVDLLFVQRFSSNPNLTKSNRIGRYGLDENNLDEKALDEKALDEKALDEKALDENWVYGHTRRVTSLSN